MENDSNSSVSKEGKPLKNNGSGIVGAVYTMAFVGAAVYFIQHAGSFWAGVLGILKALFWPGVVIYKLLELWKM